MPVFDVRIYWGPQSCMLHTDMSRGSCPVPSSHSRVYGDNNICLVNDITGYLSFHTQVNYMGPGS